ncbi:hypothetical protein BDFB_004399, partial [Asbolus verrucosus]
IALPNKNRLWWERYQPVSYHITKRSGNEAEFTEMIMRCSKSTYTLYFFSTYFDSIYLDNDVVENKEYISLGAVIELKYSTAICKIFSGLYNLTNLVNCSSEWNFISEYQTATVFINSCSNQKNKGILT